MVMDTVVACVWRGEENCRLSPSYADLRHQLNDAIEASSIAESARLEAVRQLAETDEDHRKTNNGWQDTADRLNLRISQLHEQLAEAAELHLADESTIYQLQQGTAIKVLKERLAEAQQTTVRHDHAANLQFEEQHMEIIALQREYAEKLAEAQAGRDNFIDTVHADAQAQIDAIREKQHAAEVSAHDWHYVARTHEERAAAAEAELTTLRALVEEVFERGGLPVGPSWLARAREALEASSIATPETPSSKP